MKILHITNNYPTQDFPIFGIFVKEQIDSLTDRGIENEIFFINGREEGRKAYINGVISLRKKLKKGGYDILHCHHAFSAFILFLTFRFFRFKTIVSYQNDPDREGGRFLYKIINFFFNCIILKNNKKEFLTKKTFYLPNGVNTRFFKNYEESECKKIINLTTQKKYILFMDSYKRRTQKRIDRFNETIAILQKNGNPDNFDSIILTNTKRELVPYYMSISAVHLITSDFEGSPNSVKECLSCNTKVVSTPVGNINDLIGDVPGCYISETFNPEELASLVKEAVKHNSFNGRDKVIEKKLDIQSVAEKLENLYEKI